MHQKFPIERYLLFWLFMISQPVFCQLNDFNFSVSTTDETCSGNGSISMTVSDITPDATLTYTLYLYPDTDTPIAQTTANIFSNLNSGAYFVVATQTLGNLQNTQSADATINDETSALDFEVGQAFMGDCDSATLTVTMLSGNAESYEIISGPVIVPPQSDNTFNNLPEGSYVIRVYDTCGNALTKTFTVVLINDPFEIDPVELPSVLANCEETTITNPIIAENEGMLAYPITVSYTVYPPDGSTPVNYSTTYNSGPEMELEVSETISIFDEQLFDIDIVAEDLCGNVVSITEEIDPNPNVDIITTEGFCGKNFNVTVKHFLPPYTLEFTEAPSDFEPSAFNEDIDGTYNTGVVAFGQEDASVPYGVYSVIVIDACGRIGTDTIEIEEEPIEPFVNPSNVGCNPDFGAVTINIPDREAVSATFTEVPENYSATVPVDVSNFITGSGIFMGEDLPEGDYILELIDNCGSIYVIEFTIPTYTQLPLSIFTSPNCVTETGTLRISSPYGDIESMLITAAPDTFEETLPFDYSSQISAIGIFYVGDFPEGNYTLEFTDSCGNEFVLDQLIEAYSTDPSIYTLQRNCGSFDVGISDSNQNVYDKSYWFQKYYPASDSWGHPNTGVLYTEGDMPNTTNSREIQNEETLFNIFVTGEFRLIKAFQPYNNPNPGQRCYDVFAEFEVTSELEVKGVYNLNCDGGSGPSDVLVDVIGVPPYDFSIVSPITIENGNDNVFTNLSPGTYEIKVEDVCGSIETIIVNLQDLLPVVSVLTPPDLVLCSEMGSTQATFDLSQQYPLIIGNQNPDNLTVTYHLSQNDADTGANPLPDSYELTSSMKTIYVRVIHNTLNICYETTSFKLVLGSPPQLGPDETLLVCDGDAIMLSVNPSFANYLWSTGETTPSISVDESGAYTVTVSKEYNGFYCDATKTFTVDISGTATIENIVLEDFSAINNSITVEVSGFGDYVYSIDGVYYQPDGYFDNLQTGEYTIYVKDEKGCGIVTEDVYLLNYRKYFTPNGDDQHEYWQISGSQFEPDLKIFIFDRYGKILTSFRGDDRGWDGVYNGHNMPTNDYWFVVERGNGATYKGHFTLKR